MEIPLADLVVSNKNVRKTLSDQEEETTLENLANDIRANGLINPLSVRLGEDGKYEIYAGQRRYLALRQLKREKAVCKVEELDDNKAELISLSENLQRNKMTQADKCEIFYKLYLMNNQNVNEVAKKVSYANYTIKDYITVKENLAQELFKNLDEKGDEKLSMEIAVYLCKHIQKDFQVEVFNAIKHLGTTHLKKQAISDYSDKPDDEDPAADEDSTGEDGKEKNEEGESDDKKQKKKIPMEPWVWDEDENPVLIPKELQYHVLQMIRNN